MMRRWTAVAMLLALTTGCVVGPNYKRPTVNSPAGYYGEQNPQAESVADVAWWDLFKDPVLQGLIHEALKNNYDVALAASRIEQARAQAGISKSVYFPQVGYGGGVTGQRTQVVRPDAYYNYGFTLAWEVDLWGRIRRLNEQQLGLLLSTQEAQRGVWLSLVGDVAQAYFELRALDAQMAIAQKTSQSFGETFGLFDAKLKGGAASALETSRAEGALAGVMATMPDLQRQIAAKENQINFLLGRAPGPIPRGAALAEQNDPDAVPAGLPADLLARRPDVRALEQQLVAANAAVGVAKANYYPVISLTGLLGGVSPELSELVDSGKQWSAGAGLAGPLFTGGRLKAAERVALAQRDQAQISYQQSLTRALGEVSTALTAHQQLAESLKQQSRSIAAYQESVRLADLRYNSGLSSYFEVVDAKLQLFPAETARVQYDLGRKVALVNLYKALGGGWKLTNEQFQNGGAAGEAAAH